MSLTLMMLASLARRRAAAAALYQQDLAAAYPSATNPSMTRYLPFKACIKVTLAAPVEGGAQMVTNRWRC